jgi:HK97 family phage major capsid protein
MSKTLTPVAELRAMLDGDPTFIDKWAMQAERLDYVEAADRILTVTRGRAMLADEQRAFDRANDAINLIDRVLIHQGRREAESVALRARNPHIFPDSAPFGSRNDIGHELLDAVAEVRSGKVATRHVELESRSLTEAGAAGGAVPIQLMTPERTLRAQSVVMSLPGVRMVSMTSDRTRFPRIGGNVAYGVAETATLTEDTADVDLVDLVAVKFAVYTEFSSELVEDMSADALAVFGDNALEGLARKIDAQFLEGNGSGPGLVGIRNLAGVNSTAVAATPADFDKWSDAKYEAQADNADPSIWLGHPRSWNTLSKIKTGISSDKTTLLAPSPQTAAQELLGMPVYLSTQITLTEGAGAGSWMAAIDPSQLIIGIRRAASVEVSRDYKFGSDVVALRATARVGFAALNPEGISLLTDIRA